MAHSIATNKKVLEDMLSAACHFGHRVARWNPKMRRYIYTTRDGIHIFDVTKIQECLARACEFLDEMASKGKLILMVSTKLQATKLVTAAAVDAGAPYVTRKWMPGLLTNFETIRKRIKYFKELKEQKLTGSLEKYTKKEQLELTRTLDTLQDAFGGVENMPRLPDVVVVFDAVRDVLALREAKKLNIPTVGVCDSNADPDLLTYPIPGNDDAVKSLQFFMDAIKDAIKTGTRKQEQAQVPLKP